MEPFGQVVSGAAAQAEILEYLRTTLTLAKYGAGRIWRLRVFNDTVATDIAASGTRSLNSSRFRNSEYPFFLFAIGMAFDPGLTAGTLADIGVRLRDSSGAILIGQDAPVPFATLAVSGSASDAFGQFWLPDPYPIPKDGSFDVFLENFNGSARGPSVSLVGYQDLSGLEIPILGR